MITKGFAPATGIRSFAIMENLIEDESGVTAGCHVLHTRLRGYSR
jgi:hypothetical protein